MKALDSSTLDYESSNEVKVNVSVSDGVLTDTAVITINLIDDRDEDADGDGLTEAQEEDIHGTSDLDSDSDNDGLNDGFEVALGINPKFPDSDNDGYTDAEEVAVDRDPADSTNFPNEAPVIVDQVFTIAEWYIQVGSVIATDANKEDTLTYTVTDEGNDFVFEGNVLKAVHSNVLDYEVATQLKVNVLVNDGVLTDNLLKLQLIL